MNYAIDWILNRCLSKHSGFLLLLIMVFGCTGEFENGSFINIDAIEEQLLLLDHNVQKALAVTATGSGGQELIVPHSLVDDGLLHLVPGQHWCSGFYPGALWYMYELTGEAHWKTKAVSYTAQLEQEKLNSGTHDMGFKMMCSFGNGLRITGDNTYREILIQSAKTLITRYNGKVGCIRSWDWNAHVWQFPVIIDNLMNLELLFRATGETGDSLYYNIAVQHAITTLNNHFREDYSSYHVVDYDILTGDVLIRQTFQGYSDESSWSRGQAWGLYGYTMVYRFTGEKLFLDQAEKIASFLLDHPNLPGDLVPYWDFDAPEIPDEPRDVSAAAVMASALYELSRYSDHEVEYLASADQILKSLDSPDYLSAPGENKGFLLDHSVGSLPGNAGVDVPHIYADYYYLEAVSRKRALSE